MPSTWSFGSTGTDWSVNAKTVPIATYVLLQTIPVNKKRHQLGVQNLSTDTVQLVKDDGAGNQQTSIMLAPASGSPAVGSIWTSTTFKGRLRIYAATATDCVSAYED